MIDVSRFNDIYDIVASVITAVFTASLFVNSSLSLFLLERFYPSHVPGKKLRITLLTSMIINIIIYIILAGIFCLGFYEQFLSPEGERETSDRGKIILTVIAIMLGTGIYLTIHQISLRKTIRRNYTHEINSFLEESAI